MTRKKPTNPFDDLYDQISHLLNFVQNHTLISMEENKIPSDIEQRLEKLRKKIESFNKISEDIVKLSGVSDEELKLRLAGESKEVPEDGQQLIQRGKEISKEAEKIDEELEKTLRYVPLSEKSLSAAPDTPKTRILDDKEYTKKRRSKFKRFGSDKNWKPL